jgi:hypothetical protein
MECERCNTETNSYGFSYFNVDALCQECLKKERVHPDFRKAYQADLDAIKKGDWNFAGIGLPNDLKVVR